MQPVQSVPSTSTTTPATTERINAQAVVDQDQESTAIDRIQELVTFMARIQELPSRHGDIKTPPENVVQISAASSMQIDIGMVELIQVPDNAFYYADTMYASSVTMSELLSNAGVRYARYPKSSLLPVATTLTQDVNKK